MACGAAVGGSATEAISLQRGGQSASPERRLYVESHDMPENTSTYAEFWHLETNSILLQTRDLRAAARFAGDVQGELKMRASPTMLLKTHVEKMSLVADPTMLVKTKLLILPTPRCS